MLGAVQSALLGGSLQSVRPIINLHADANFTDSGSLGLTWSDSSSKVVVQTTNKKFGAGALGRNAQDTLGGLNPSSLTWLDFTKDFVLEGWMYSNEVTGIARNIVSMTNGTSLRGITIRDTNQKITVLVANGAGSFPVLNVQSPTLSALAHIAIEFYGGNIFAYCNGTKFVDNVALGSAPTVTSMALLGNAAGQTTTSSISPLDEFTVWNYAKYQGVASFTPPTVPY